MSVKRSKLVITEDYTPRWEAASLVLKAILAKAPGAFNVVETVLASALK